MSNDKYAINKNSIFIERRGVRVHMFNFTASNITRMVIASQLGRGRRGGVGLVLDEKAVA